MFGADGDEGTTVDWISPARAYVNPMRRAASGARTLGVLALRIDLLSRKRGCSPWTERPVVEAPTRPDQAAVKVRPVDT